MNDQTYSSGPGKKMLPRMLGAVAGTGLLVGGVVVALGGAASADKPAVIENRAADQGELVVESSDGEAVLLDGDAEVYLDDELGEADIELFAAYDQCLSDAGVPVFETWSEADDGAEYEVNADEVLEAEWLEEDWEEFDNEHQAAFESCEPILDDLSAEMFIEELSLEDEEVFAAYGQCLSDAGVPVFEVDGPGEAESFIVTEGDEMLEGEILEGEEWAVLDDAFAECDPILGSISGEVIFSEAIAGDDSDGFEVEMLHAEMSDGEMVELDAAFEEFEGCLADAGIDVHESDGVESFAIADEDIDSIESCQAILESIGR